MVQANIVEIQPPVPAETSTEVTGEILWTPEFLTEIDDIRRCDDLGELIDSLRRAKTDLGCLLRDSMERVIVSGALLQRAFKLARGSKRTWSAFLAKVGVSEATARRHRRIFREFEKASAEERKSIAAGGVRGFLQEYGTGNGRKNGNEGSSGKSNANGRRRPESEVEDSNPQGEEQPESKSEDSDLEDDDWSDTTLDDPQETADTAVEAKATAPNTAATGSTEGSGSMTPAEEFFALCRRLRELEEPIKRQINEGRESITRAAELEFRGMAPKVRELLNTVQDLL